MGRFENGSCSLRGSVIPLARARQERLDTDDRRLLLEERFLTKEAYIKAMQGNLILFRPTSGLHMPELTVTSRTGWPSKMRRVISTRSSGVVWAFWCELFIPQIYR